MKQKMKRLVSIIALMVMMVSMFSVYSVSVSAAEESDYAALLRSAMVVNAEWAGTEMGDPISFVFNGKTETTEFDPNFHFVSFNDAWAQVQAMGIKNPIILLCAGQYTEEIVLTSGVTLLGPNVGIDPVKKVAAKDAPWEKAARSDEAVIMNNIIVDKKVGEGNITFDGLSFGAGGAFVDYARAGGSSEITVKNTVFENAGNANRAMGFVFFMRNDAHSRKLNLKNLYITGINTAKPNSNSVTNGFIGAFFDELYADNIAYIDCQNGFVAKSWFIDGISPVVELTNSCFYNSEEVSANGYVLSLDIMNYGINYTAPNTQGNHSLVDLQITSGSSRPRSNVKIRDNVFYNASAADGVFHFQLIGLSNFVDIQNNYFCSPESAIPFMDTEFVLDSKSVDQTSCFKIRNNHFLNTYVIPDMEGSNEATHLDLSYNYFGTPEGKAVYQPAYTNEDTSRILRSAFWVNEEMTVDSSPWDLKLGGSWPFATLDQLNYVFDIIYFAQGNNNRLDVEFISEHGLDVQLYRNATFDDDGMVVDVSDPLDGISLEILNSDIYNATPLYVQVKNKDYPSFAPIYKIFVVNNGKIDSKPFFSDVYPAGHGVICSEVEGMATGTMYPYRWQGNIYKFRVGKDIFANVDEALQAFDKGGFDSPTIMFPAGVYNDIITIPGSCTILGEKHGVNPNTKPYDVLTREDFARSPWSLSAARAKDVQESVFAAPIMVAESADDYVITIDGIKMIDGSAFYDNGSRTNSNVVIMKNVHIDGAGKTIIKGINYNDVFNLKKTSSSDSFHFYIYDCRIENLDSINLFTAPCETMIVDNTYIGNMVGNSYIFSNYSGRDTAENYTAMTNCYVYNLDTCRNASGGAYIIWNFLNSSLTNKIVYNFDGNVFNNVYPYGYSGMHMKFTGNNMRVYYTNNTVYSTTNKDQLFGIGGTRFVGNSTKENVSDMIIMKGNRLIGMNRLFMTADAGPGTMYDYSGNYFAGNLNASSGLTPTSGAMRFQSNTSLNPQLDYRVRMDYTFLDWDMTIRSDSDAADTKLEYDFVDGSKVSTGTGDIDYVYTDTVEATKVSYDVPITVGEYCNYKIYTSPDKTGAVPVMNLSGAENIFYLVVSNNDGSESETIKVIIHRGLNSEAKIYSYDSYMIDESSKVITAYITSPLFAFRINKVNASVGATIDLYSDVDCTVEAPYTFVVSSDKAETRYLEVVSEDGAKRARYRLDLLYVKSSDVAPVAALYGVDGMSYVGNNTYEASVSYQQETVTFTPKPLPGSEVKVYNGKTLLLADENGVYSIKNNSSALQTLKMVVTNGKQSANYTLNIRKAKSNKCELLNINNGIKTESGYVVGVQMNQAASIKADVSAGASYALYEDYMCTKPLANNMILFDKDSCEFAYLKVVSEDGTASAVHKLTVLTQHFNGIVPTIKVVANKKTYTAIRTGEFEYTVYLPKGINKVGVSGDFNRAEGSMSKTDNLTFYADPERMFMIEDLNSISLSQKITTLYPKSELFTYNGLVPPVLGDNISAVDPEGNQYPYTSTIGIKYFTLKIVSDRNAVTYSDYNKTADWAKPYIDYLNKGNYGIFNGDNKGAFNASSNITRYELATVATHVMGLDIDQYAKTTVVFADKIEKWALPYVRAAVGSGIMSGSLNPDDGKTYFYGSKKATRTEVATVFVALALRMEGITLPAADYYTAYSNKIDMTYYDSFNFADEDKIQGWAVPFIHLAVSKYNFINGSLDSKGNLNINPNKNITRAEVAVIAANFLGYNS